MKDNKSNKQRIRKIYKFNQGVGAVEYALILGFLTLLIIGIASQMQGGLNQFFTQTVNCVSGFVSSNGECIDGTDDTTAKGFNPPKSDVGLNDISEGNSPSSSLALNAESQQSAIIDDPQSQRSLIPNSSRLGNVSNGSEGNTDNSESQSTQAGSQGSGLSGSAGIGSSNSGAANSATAGSGTADSGTADSGTAGSGTAGSGTAGSGTADSGTADSGTADSGTADSGTAGSGTAGSGTADSGTADSGTADSSAADPANIGLDSIELTSNSLIADGGGSQCGGCDDVASLNSGGSLPNQTAGNPIHIPTGNKYQVSIDLEYPQLGLRFVRHYNSQHSDKSNGIGNGWKFGYSTQILNSKDLFTKAKTSFGERVVIQQGDGRKVVFELNNSEKSDGHYNGYLHSDGFLKKYDKKIVWHWPNGKRITFNNQGKLENIEFPGRAAQKLSYNEKGNLTAISSDRGNAIRLQWNASNISSVIGPDGLQVDYEYDAGNNLVNIKRNGELSESYHYENQKLPSHLTGLTNSQGIRFATWAYNHRGQAVLSQHIEGVGKVELSYQDGITTLTNSLGQKTDYHWERRDHLVVVTKVVGVGCTQCGEGNIVYEYNDELKLTAQTGRDGITRQYEWDEHSRLINVAERGKDEDESRQLIRFVYPKSGNQIKSSQPIQQIKPSVVKGKELISTLEYDENGQVTSLQQQGWRPALHGEPEKQIKREVKFKWDDNRLVSFDGPRNDVEDITRFNYDQQGLIKSVTFGNGKTIKVLAVDKAGRPTRLQHNDREPWILTYNSSGQITEINRGDLSRQFNYIDGKLASRVDSDGKKLDFQYDVAGRLVSWQDGKGRGEVVKFDTENRVTQRIQKGIDEEELWFTDFLYNDQGQLAQVVPMDGISTEIKYDERGRMVSVTDYDSENTVETAQWQYVWTAANWLETVNVLDQGVSEQQNKEKLQQFSYGKDGLLSSVIDGQNSETEFSHDDFGNLVAENSADSGLNIYKYDGANNLTKHQDAMGQITTYSYDGANQLIKISFADGNTIQFDYNKDQLNQITNTSQKEQYKYDSLGRLTLREVEWENKVKKTIVTTYDDKGRVSERRLASGKTLRYNYNRYGEVNEITVDGEQVLFDANNEDDTATEQIFVLGNGEQVTRFYSRGVLVGMNVEGEFGRQNGSGQQLSKIERQWSYDKRGNQYQSISNGELAEYKYDSRDRLVSASMPATNASFDYDANNNRLSSLIGNEASAFSYTELSNRISKVQLINTVNDISQIPLHDLSGNLLSLGDKNYSYDASGRLKNIKQSGQVIAEYAYNGWGERVKKAVVKAGSDGKKTKKITYFLYDGHQLQAEIAENGDVIAEYLYFQNKAFAKITPNGVFYIHTNTQGAPEWMTDGNQRIVWQANYLPFGEVNVEESQESLNLRFPGQYHDQESGLYYNDHRYYQPEWGRYITADPSGLNGGMNRYAYANANPVMFIDPLGLAPCGVNDPIESTQAQQGEPGIDGFDHDWRAELLLDVGGIFDPSPTLDIINGSALIADGRYVEGVLTYFGVVPVVGDIAGKGLKYVYKGGKAVVRLVPWGKVADVGVNVAKAGVRKAGQAINAVKGAGQVIGDKLSGWFGRKRTKPFVPEEHWSKNAPDNVAPGQSRLDHTKYNSDTKKYEESRVVYDEYGRQTFRVDKTDHGRSVGNGNPNDRGHTNPHLHERTYAPKGTQGHNDKTGAKNESFNLKGLENDQ